MTTSQIALITPFDHRGALDPESLERLARHYLSAGATGLVALGPAAETPALSTSEIREVLRTLRRVSDEFGALLTVSTASIGTAYAIRQARERAVFADALLARSHAAEIAAAVDIPVVTDLDLADLGSVAAQKRALAELGLIESAFLRVPVARPSAGEIDRSREALAELLPVRVKIAC